eukprot:TRINITY_DN23109_c0_g1_i1.p1 TRINITY_DN23109_c0_g1~~TRINITY_DN23109_c0_g1_i1.p1  ORF type:complete len:227 (-),score=39.78 TRINITY_DN23109_c0_g1_i1:61-741(-)
MICTMDEGSRVAATQLVSAITARIAPASIQELKHCSKWNHVAQNLVDAVSSSPNPEFFHRTQAAFFALIGCFTDEMKFRVLKYLLRKTTQQAKVVTISALLRSIKPKAAWEKASSLISVTCLDTLSKEVRHETAGACWVLDASEVLISLLNLFRFFFAKDKIGGHNSGVWEFVADGRLEEKVVAPVQRFLRLKMKENTCLLYTSDAADEEDSVDLGGRRIIKKKTK